MIVDGIDFKLFDGPVGISCSGGADSSILLYMLMLYHKDPIHIFTTVSNYKQRKTSKVSRRVIDQCIKLTGNSNIEHHLHYCEKQDINNLFSTCKDWLNNGYINIMYTGITNTPPFEVMEKFKDQIDIVDRGERSPSVEKNVLYKQFYRPFINIDKQRIADLYSYFQLIDTLFPLTRSCEWTTDYGVNDPGLGHCGKCWWCEEREWGFKRYIK